MSLTKIQKIVLLRYREFRQIPPTVAGLVQQSWKVEVILIVASALGVGIAYSFHLYAVAYILVGLVIGALARDIGSFRRVIQVWPVLEQIIDWQRVEQVLDQDRVN